MYLMEKGECKRYIYHIEAESCDMDATRRLSIQMVPTMKSNFEGLSNQARFCTPTSKAIVTGFRDINFSCVDLWSSRDQLRRTFVVLQDQQPSNNPRIPRVTEIPNRLKCCESAVIAVKPPGT
jgi:hypothetical protein